MTTTTSRRDTLRDVPSVPAQNHAGLWLDKFLAAQLNSEEGGSSDQQPWQQHIAQVAAIQEPGIYASHFSRWSDKLARAGATRRYATTSGRLIVGLGHESVLETAVALHRTYGLPLIPGSALKGLAGFVARNHLDAQRWGSDKDAYQTLFGTTRTAGCVDFFDALYKPNSGLKRHALWQDIIAVHHRKYYGNEKSPPADWDSPTLIPFLSATGAFLLALRGPKPWVEVAFKMLEYGLKRLGVGAKTSSGYGRMTLLAEGVEPGPLSVTRRDAAASGASYAVRLRELLAEDPPTGRVRGTVADVRGTFGFINPARGGKEVFVHQSQMDDPPLREGQVLEFRIGPGNKPGQTQAVEVRVLLQPERKR